jgi:hypothetical protein
MCADGSPYVIKVREADPLKIAVVLGNNDICRDEATCSRYSREQLGEWFFTSEKGIFDFNNPDNPILDHSIVFVPNCTYDGLIGNKSNDYGSVGIVHHKGAINVARALEWTATRFPDVNQIDVIGLSTGGTRGIVAAGKMSEYFPDASVSLVTDSSGPVPSELVGFGAVFADLSLDRPWPDWPTKWPLIGSDPFFEVTHNRFPNIRYARVHFAQDFENVRYFELLGQGISEMRNRILQLHAETESYGYEVALWLHDDSQHMVFNRPDFFELEQDGVLLTDWLRDFLDGVDVKDLICTEC